jgi:hypothetical protein
MPPSHFTLLLPYLSMTSVEKHRPPTIPPVSVWSRTHCSKDVFNTTSEENDGQQYQGPDR